MPRVNLKKQSKPQRPCRCGRNTIYTGSYAQHNPKIDDVMVCEDCYVEYMIHRYHNKEN